MSDVLPKKVTPEPEVAEETVKEESDGEGEEIKDGEMVKLQD